MIKVFVILVFMLALSAGPSYAGAAVAKQKMGNKPKPSLPQQLPPGYVMTPEGIKKVPQAQRLSPTETRPSVPVEDIVDLEQLMISLAASSQAWSLIIAFEDKEIIMQQFIDRYVSQGITIKKPAAFYVMMVDQMAAGNQDMLAMPFDRILQVAAVMEYDFGNGQNPDLLAQKILGKAYEKNKQRLIEQSQAQMPASK